MYNSLIDYIANESLIQRQSHKDLTTDCCFKGKSKDYTSKRRSQDAARKNMVEFLVEKGVLHTDCLNEKFGKTGQIQVNHLCSCHSGTDDVVCNNPLHIYIGTAKENWQDINPNTGKTARQSAIETKNTDESKEKASLSQKLSWAERKARILATDKE